MKNGCLFEIHTITLTRLGITEKNPFSYILYFHAVGGDNGLVFFFFSPQNSQPKINIHKDVPRFSFQNFFFFMTSLFFYRVYYLISITGILFFMDSKKNYGKILISLNQSFYFFYILQT